ncbi:4Fe-4S dicluster domain-containing protein [Candidatus Poribacteria bacterium]|nr:4Fe-4S dicluster domain-containing protein [Candidatus Poribacteria bacterium]
MFRNIRRIIQILFLLFFIFLLIKTVYPADFPIPLDFFPRYLDPLAASATMLASRSISMLIIPMLIVIILALLLGRFFCGWICPMGTTIDISDRILFRRFKRPKIKHNPRLRNLKYYILVAFIVGAAFSLQMIWFADPISIVTRSYGVILYPYFSYVTRSTFDTLYLIKGVNLISEPIYGVLRNNVLTLFQPTSRMLILFFSVFAVIISLSIIQRRFWCRNLCPLGALHGLLSTRLNFWRRRVNENCIECGKCRRECGLGAIPEDPRKYWPQECTECMSCRDVCPVNAISFGLKQPFFDKPKTTGLNLSRRSFVKSALAGIAAVPLLKLNYSKKKMDEAVIRPPGSLPEEQFLDKCIRCGECMKVCPTNGLQPAFMEAGVEGIGTPILVPEVGYCEYVCTSCTKICPTDAIIPLKEKEKQSIKIGTARIDKDRCIPWSEYENCLVCEEQCPVPTKAIKFETKDVVTFNGEIRRLKMPVVLKDKCIGCGICENKCPVSPKAAILVTGQIPGKESHGGLHKAADTSTMEQPSPQAVGKIKVPGQEE